LQEFYLPVKFRFRPAELDCRLQILLGYHLLEKGLQGYKTNMACELLIIQPGGGRIGSIALDQSENLQTSYINPEIGWLLYLQR
jgi:hypothetical protein